MNDNAGVRPWQWIITAIVVIVLIILGVMMFRGGDDSSTDMTGGDNTNGDSLATGSINRIVISDQFPGNIVYISSVQLANGGWVVIHKDNAGKPGAIIGQTYFEKGINPGRVNLTESTMEGGVYYAMIHSDNGDKVFDATKDMPLKDSAGNIIMKPFRATTNVTEFKG